MKSCRLNEITIEEVDTALKERIQEIAFKSCLSSFKQNFKKSQSRSLNDA
jgi:hypothetical protein